MKFKITITKEVIDRSKNCGMADGGIAKNCAFAVAYNQLVPNVFLSVFTAYFEKHSLPFDNNWLAKVTLSKEQTDFIQSFDNMKPNERYSLVGREFEVEIPDSVIEYWHGDVVKAAQSIIDNPILKPLQLETV